jgi:hypothetical protein
MEPTIQDATHQKESTGETHRTVKDGYVKRELPPAKISTLQEWAEEMDRQFNKRYYRNPYGKPEFYYGKFGDAT